jgi:transcriptional regulator with XRE-family HTH domain
MMASEFFPITPSGNFCDNYGMDGDAFVRRLRARLDSDESITPAGLAKRAGVDNSTIRKMLSIDGASPRMATAEKICAALGTTVRDFMSDQPDPVGQEIVSLYTRLTPEERRLLLAAARGMLARDHEAS